MINTIFLLDKNKKIVDSLSNNGDLPKSPFFNDKYVQQLATGAETYEFSTFSNERTNKYCQGGGYIAFQYNNKVKMFQIMDIEDEHKEGKIVKSCYCEVAGLELINSTFREREATSVNIKQFMDMALEGTSWSLGILDVGITSVLSVSVDKPVNVYSFLQTYIPKFGAEIEFRVELNGNRVVAQYIDVYLKRGRETRKRFEHGQNISAISRKIDFSNIATALIGRGKNNIDFKTVEWLSDKPALKPLNQDFIADEGAFDTYNKNGEHIMGIYENSECESPDELVVLTWNALQERKNPRFSYDVKTEMIFGDESEINIGDTIYVIDNDYEPALYLSARIGQLDMSFSDHTKNKCTLTNYREVKSDILSLSTIQAIIDGRFPIGTGDIQDGAINGDKLHNGQIITGTHLFANSITADKIKAGEITADHIATGSITADKVQAGLIEVGSTIIADGAITTKHIAADSINAGHINAGSVNADHIAAGTIVSGSGIIAEGAIGSAQISNLEANKISAGTIDTSKVQVAGPNGNLTLRGNRMQVFSGHGNEQFERVSLGDVDNDGTKYGLRVRGEDGTTILYDENGVYQEGITDGSINNDKIADDANIEGYKLDINSVVREVNGATETISGTKISVDGTNLEVKLSEQETTITEQGKEIKSNTTRVEANEDQIKLKVDEQKYTQDMAGVNGILEKHSASIEVNKDAITNKVDAAWVQEQGYQTGSQVQQTVDKWEAKFSESGGYNLLYNGDFKRNGDKWSINDSSKVAFSQGLSCPNGRGVSLNSALGTTTMIAQYGAKLETNAESITASYYTYVSSSGEDGTTNKYRRGELSLTYTDDTKSYHGLPDVSTLDKWERVSVTIKPQKKVKQASMSLLNRDTTRTVYYSAVMVEKGELVSAWSPNPNEVSDGIVTLDNDGILVENTSSDTNTRLDSSSLAVNNNKGGTVAEFGRNSLIPNLVSGTISADSIYAPNIVTIENTAIYIYVDMTNGNDNNTGSSSSKFKTIQAALDSLSKYFNDVSVQINISGIGTQDVRVKGFVGAGELRFFFNNGAKLYTNLFDIRECGVRVMIQGHDTWSTSIGQIIQSDEGSLIYCRNTSFVKLYHICLCGAGKGKGVAVNSYGSNVVLSGCEVDRFYGAIYADNNGYGSIINTTGSDLNYVTYGKDGGRVLINDGVVPNADNLYATNIAFQVFKGTNVNKVDGEIYKPSTQPTPPPNPTTNTRTWNFNKIWSDETLNGWSDRQELIQGYASTWNTGRWTGYMQMNDDFSEIRSAISGATNLSGRLYVQRKTSSGQSTDSKLCLYGSDGTVVTTSQSINQGQGVWVSLSSSIVQKIQSGAIKYFYLKADSSSQATYFKCESNPKIEITYTK